MSPMQPEWIVAAVVASAAIVVIVAGRWRRGEPLARQGAAEPVVWDGMDVLWVVVVALLLQSLAAAIGPLIRFFQSTFSVAGSRRLFMISRVHGTARDAMSVLIIDCSVQRLWCLPWRSGSRSMRPP